MSSFEDLYNDTLLRIKLLTADLKAANARADTLTRGYDPWWADKIAIANADKNAALEENRGLLLAIKKRQKQIGNLLAELMAANARADAGGWQPADTAPKTGEYFTAWDEVYECCMYTMHWDEDEFLTDNEAWSGRFSHWRKPIQSPESKLHEN